MYNYNGYLCFGKKPAWIDSTFTTTGCICGRYVRVIIPPIGNGHPVGAFCSEPCECGVVTQVCYDGRGGVHTHHHGESSHPTYDCGQCS